MAVTHDALPVELWLEIFSCLEERSDPLSYAPFKALPGVEWDVKSAYTNIVLVCRNWHTWAIGLLYHTIRLPDPSSVQMDDACLEVHQRYGHWVRCAIVPYSSTVTESFKPMLSTKILALYPSLQSLVRPPHPQSPMQTLQYKFDATCPPLPSLKRLEWWNHPAASPTGGINSLAAVLAAAPNIEYLFLGVERRKHFPRDPVHVHLPSLHTLRLHNSPWSSMHPYFTNFSLPALKTLIIDAGAIDVDIERIFQSSGSQLGTLEFGQKAYFSDDFPSLRSCPVLREINYSCYAPSPSEATPGTVYPSVTSIGIHFDPHMDPLDTMDVEEWGFLEQHFRAFVGEMFPNLQRLRFYGAAQPVLMDSRFTALHERLLTSRGCVLEIADANGHLSLYTP
ncbi:hypothetical protein C8R46DRAFT_1225746 [Mycena filopes]|nr:hypothetical protein C8R46DRAFT_1225746 [Mycena filopes]